MASNVGLTFSVGDTTLQFKFSIVKRQLELLILNVIFSGVIYWPKSITLDRGLLLSRPRKWFGFKLHHPYPSYLILL